MPKEIFYSEQVDERVATYIVQHGGKVQTERVDPGWAFHKVTIEYTRTKRIGGGDYSPIYEYTLADGGKLLIQNLRGRGSVPGHPDHYWTALYIWKEGSNGADKTRTETR